MSIEGLSAMDFEKEVLPKDDVVGEVWDGTWDRIGSGDGWDWGGGEA